MALYEKAITEKDFENPQMLETLVKEIKVRKYF